MRTWKTAGLVFRTARRIREKYYGKRVFIRGLIEFTNYCRNDCYYCGIRRSNQEVSRYRLTPDEILSCCEEGRRLGFRTFVLQGGEDLNFEGREGLRGDRALAKVVEEIKRRFPDCAVTLSVGERDREVYEQWFQAGATAICSAMRQRRGALQKASPDGAFRPAQERVSPCLKGYRVPDRSRHDGRLTGADRPSPC